ncbi:MAG: hypothetical protein RRX92_08150 [Lachnospiraceae bacterium]
MMKTINYWDSFMQSGNIADYLSFKQTKDDCCNQQNEKAITGDSEYAGLPNDNGNCNESSTHRGI